MFRSSQCLFLLSLQDCLTSGHFWGHVMLRVISHFQSLCFTKQLVAVVCNCNSLLNKLIHLPTCTSQDISLHQNIFRNRVTVLVYFSSVMVAALWVASLFTEKLIFHTKAAWCLRHFTVIEVIRHKPLDLHDSLNLA